MTKRALSCASEAGLRRCSLAAHSAAVVLPDGYRHEGLDDSKKLSERRREELYEELTNDVLVYWSVAFVVNPCSVVL